jgi:dihydrofolate reductase
MTGCTVPTPETGSLKVCLIVVVADNGVIGMSGAMPWHLPSELKYFRARTIGKPVIMGRKTFQSIGKPLPGRDNIVITRDVEFKAPGATVVATLEAAMAAGRVAAAKLSASEIMVIGGAEIYRQALASADRVYLTRIHVTPAGDTFFPPLDAAHWVLADEKPLAQAADELPRATVCIYDRIGTRLGAT